MTKPKYSWDDGTAWDGTRDIILDGVELWLHLIRRFKLTPREALQSMQDHGKDVAKVLIYIEDILNTFTINLKGE